MTRTIDEATFENELEDLIATWEVDTFAGVSSQELVETFMRIVKSFEYQNITRNFVGTTEVISNTVAEARTDA